MKELVAQTRTMSSTEIAVLTGKDKSHVHRDIKIQLLIGLYGLNDDPKMDLIDVKGISVKYDKKGFWSDVLLDREHTLTLITGYDVKSRHVINKRWLELEESTKKLTLTATMSDAMQAATIAATYLNLPETGKLLMLDSVNKAYGNILALPTYGVDAGTNPTITSGSSRVTFSATTLLKQFAIPCSAVKFNQLAESKGFIETKTRPSSGTKTKEYKSIVGEGLKYGKNITSPSNPRETQPHWFEDSFEDFAAKVL